MERYEVLDRAGSGNFSDVYRARDIHTGQIVAIKEMKRCEDAEQLALKELKILSTLNHPNIIQLKEVITHQGDIKVVFEYVDENLLQLYEASKTGINQNQIKCILYQSAFALEYLHSTKKIIHRDIKPENILIDRKKALIKLIDFGLAKEESLATTDYVATRWYRSPENLVGLRKSTTAIDIFALACVIVELFTLTPLFPGDNTMDQLHKVFNILGTPTEENWAAGYHQMRRKGMSFLPKSKTSLRHIMTNASQFLVDLLQQMLILNPERRMNARQIMMHPFFQRVERVIPGTIHKQASRYLQQIRERRKTISIVKSLSPNTANVSNARYSPHQGLHSRSDSLNKQKASKEANAMNGLSFTNKNLGISIPKLPLNGSHSFQLKEVQNQSRIGYNAPTAKVQSPLGKIIPTQGRWERMISLNHPSYGKKSPLATKRDDERYMGIDSAQMQNIKRKMYQNQGTTSPKYNVRYFKQSTDGSRPRRNLSLVAQNRLMLHKSMEHAPLTINSKVKNVLASKMNFRSG